MALISRLNNIVVSRLGCIPKAKIEAMDEIENKARGLKKEQRVTFGLRGCLSALLGFIVGAAVAAGFTVFLWYRINPPYGPDYGEGVGWTLALIFWPLVGSLFGGVIGALIGVIYGTKRK